MRHLFLTISHIPGGSGEGKGVVVCGKKGHAGRHSGQIRGMERPIFLLCLFSIRRKEGMAMSSSWAGEGRRGRRRKEMAYYYTTTNLLPMCSQAYVVWWQRKTVCLGGERDGRPFSENVTITYAYTPCAFSLLMVSLDLPARSCLPTCL